MRSSSKKATTCHHFNLRHTQYEKCGVVRKLENCNNTITEVIYLAIRKSPLYAKNHQVDDLCPKLAQWKTTFRWQFTKV